MPPLIQSYFFATNIFKKTCFSDNTSFSIDTSSVIDAISWDFGDPASSANNTSTNLNATHTFTTAGNYDITISIGTKGETQLVFRTVTIGDRPPVLDLEPLFTFIIDGDNASFNLVGPVPDTILNDSNIIESFYNSMADADIRENSIVSPTEYSTSQTNETIFIRLDSANGNCFSVSELKLNIIDTPEIEEYEAYFFCDNDNNAQITIDVGNLLLPASSYNFLWLDSNETSAQIQVNQEGTYTVRIILASSITVENPDGCYAERTLEVNASSIATITNIETNGNIATIFTTGLGDYEYALDNINSTYQANTVFTNITPGTHTIFVRDINECGITDAEFSLVSFPSYFTPNGDGINDNWQVLGQAKDFQTNSSINIYNRFGKLITKLKPNDPL